MERAAARERADDGRVRHRLHQHLHRRGGRQPTYDEYAQIMTGYTPEQVPVLTGIARAFGVFDHWFSEVPSQTFMIRSFWTAGTSSGFVTNTPAKKWTTEKSPLKSGFHANARPRSAAANSAALHGKQKRRLPTALELKSS